MFTRQRDIIGLVRTVCVFLLKIRKKKEIKNLRTLHQKKKKNTESPHTFSPWIFMMPKAAWMHNMLSLCGGLCGPKDSKGHYISPLKHSHHDAHSLQQQQQTFLFNEWILLSILGFCFSLWTKNLSDTNIHTVYWFWIEWNTLANYTASKPNEFFIQCFLKLTLK